MSEWKLSPLDGSHNKGCLNCGPLAHTLPMDAWLAVGFGSVSVTRDDDTIWSGDDPEKTVEEFEVFAAGDPDHDWRITFNAPLYGASYQRHGFKSWVLVERNEGFA